MCTGAALDLRDGAVSFWRAVIFFVVCFQQQHLFSVFLVANTCTCQSHFLSDIFLIGEPDSKNLKEYLKKLEQRFTFFFQACALTNLSVS